MAHIKQKVLDNPVLQNIKTRLQSLSYKTGLIILSFCIPCYILSFAQMTWDISYTAKGVLWVILFGLAKTFQYTGILILGAEGIKRLKQWYTKIRKSEVS